MLVRFVQRNRLRGDGGASTGGDAGGGGVDAPSGGGGIVPGGGAVISPAGVSSAQRSLYRRSRAPYRLAGLGAASDEFFGTGGATNFGKNRSRLVLVKPVVPVIPAPSVSVAPVVTVEQVSEDKKVVTINGRRLVVSSSKNRAEQAYTSRTEGSVAEGSGVTAGSVVVSPAVPVTLPEASVITTPTGGTETIVSTDSGSAGGQTDITSEVVAADASGGDLSNVQTVAKYAMFAFGGYILGDMLGLWGGKPKHRRAGVRRTRGAGSRRRR